MPRSVMACPGARKRAAGWLAAGIVLIALLAVFPPAHAQEEGVATVDAEGLAPIRGGDQARAREAAVREALRKAVRQVLAEILGVGDAAGLPGGAESLLARPERFVDTYSVLQEGLVGNAYGLQLRVAVVEDFLAHDLERMGIRREGASAPRRRPVSVRVLGVRDFPQFVRVRTELSNLPAVRHVLPRQVSPGLVLLDVETSETPARLAEQVGSAGCFVVRGQRESPGRLEIEFKP